MIDLNTLIALAVSGQELPHHRAPVPSGLNAVGHFTGREHGLVAQEYLSDDEYLADVEPEFDRYAYEQWHHAAAGEGAYEDYEPEPDWEA